ncbi:MAG: DUF1638 domain-containing protein [Candidatus Omnitrophota bacterium]
MSEKESFKGITIVTCAVMRRELQKLQDEGFLDADGILFTTAGNHEKPWDMERELPEKLKEAAEKSGLVIVALGKKCYFNTNTPEKTIDDLIAETGVNAVRVNAEDCIDMLSDKQMRKKVEETRTVYWITPGWLMEKDNIFGDWDQGKANETFPRHDAALMLDVIGFFNEISMTDPEALLGFADWMQIPIEPVEVGMDRLKKLLLSSLELVKTGQSSFEGR